MARAENGFRANYTIALNVRRKPVFRKTLLQTVGGDKEKPLNSEAHGIFSKCNGMLFMKSYNTKVTLHVYVDVATGVVANIVLNTNAHTVIASYVKEDQ